MLASCRQIKKTDKEAKTQVEEAKETVSTTASTESSSGFVLDDAEEGNYWSPVRDAWSDWGNAFMVNEFSIATDTSNEWSSQGDNSLVFEYDTFAGDAENKGAHFFCTDLMETDWSAYSKLTVDVNNLSSTELALQLYTKTGEWYWGDTDALTVIPGESTISFDITEKAAVDPTTVLEMGFVLYGCTEANKLLVDNIRLE